MKHLHSLLLLLALALTALLAGCGGGGGSSSAVVQGLVTDGNGAPIPGVTVQVGAATTSTGADGKFTLTVTPSANMKVAASKAGLLGTFDMVTLTNGQTIPVNFTMIGVGSSNHPVNMDTQQTAATDGRGGGVTLPPGSVVDGNGNAVATATVDVTTVEPADANFADNFPGLFIGNQGGADQAIESFGFVTVDITSGGQKCQLGAGKTAEIAIPVAAGADPGTPTIPLWSLDDATGKWVFVVDATRDATGPTVVYRATVSHFSTYNLDRPIQAGMPFTVTVLDDKTPVAGAMVAVTSTNAQGGIWQDRAVTGADGTYRFVNIPQGSVTVTATYGTLKGSGYMYQVNNNEATMTITLVHIVTKVLTCVQVVNGVETPVAGAHVQAFGEGVGKQGLPFTGVTAADGTVTLELATGMNFYSVSANATINGENWGAFSQVQSFTDIPSKLTLTKNGAAVFTRKR